MPSWGLGRISLWLALAKSNPGWRRRSLRLLRPLLFTPRPKRARGSDKGKSKIDNVITPDELRILSVVPSHELVNRHVHKLVQILFYPNLLLLLSSLSLETILILFIFHYVLGEGYLISWFCLVCSFTLAVRLEFAVPEWLTLVVRQMWTLHFNQNKQLKLFFPFSLKEEEEVIFTLVLVFFF